MDPKQSKMCVYQSARAMTMIELLIALVLLGMILTLVTPSIGYVRSQIRSIESADNLRTIGQARDQYALDSKDLIATYTWRAGETYTMPDGSSRTPNSLQDAAAWQNLEILQRRTGRTNGTDRILSNTSVLTHRRDIHIPLMDYIAADDNTSFPSPEFVDPEDRMTQIWHENPLNYRRAGNSFPGHTETFGYDTNFSFGRASVIQRYAFSTSYLSVPFAWQGDGPDDVYGPVSNTPHLYRANGSPDLSGRSMNEVQFPSAKVHMYEEFDRGQKKHPYFAYAFAQPEKLMFDGSINSQVSGDSNSSYDPSDPNGPVWRQTYVPIYPFPIPIQGLNSDHLVNMRYQWTKHGLQGVDYAP